MDNRGGRREDWNSLAFGEFRLRRSIRKGTATLRLLGIGGLVLRGCEASMPALYSACFDESRGFLAWLRNPSGRLDLHPLPY